MDCSYHNTPGKSTSCKYVIKIPRFGSGISEELIIFMNLVQKRLVGQNVTTVPFIYECRNRVLIGDAKADFLQQTNLAVTHTVVNFTTVTNTMTAYIVPT